MRAELANITGKKVILAASTGGHLTQLVRLEPILGVDPDSTWVTFDAPQSRSLLRGRNVVYVPYVAPRDVRGVARTHRLIRSHLPSVDGAVSTGAAVALGVLPAVAASGKPSVYVESVSRIDGPSLTGRILRRVPGVGLYAQHATWPCTPWRVGPSVLDTYSTVRHEGTPRGPLKVLVALGTIKPYRFDRLVNAALPFVRNTPCEVTWQLGCTTRDDLPGTVTEQMEERAFRAAVRESDVVITHSGVGVALTILDEGRIPVLMAREPQHGEHVDTHQAQIHRYLVDAGLAVDAISAFTSSAALDYVLHHRVRGSGSPAADSRTNQTEAQASSSRVR